MTFEELHDKLLDHERWWRRKHLQSPPYTPQHIGTAERKHRHIVETSLTLLHHSSLPITYWTASFQTVVYLINRMQTPYLQFLSPYQKLFSEIPNYYKLRPFGCLCYPYLRPYAAYKLHPRSKGCIFLGYSNPHNAYLCLDHTSSKVYVTRHVLLYETIFPFRNINTLGSNSTQTSFSLWNPVHLPNPTPPSSHSLPPSLPADSQQPPLTPSSPPNLPVLQTQHPEPPKPSQPPVSQSSNPLLRLSTLQSLPLSPCPLNHLPHVLSSLVLKLGI
ncbi:hypothetical protein DCAR_0935999 [Daucus carota subsp. sativus]|uniref:Integrase catalytic domain-containing protein n=1 Tax=Daucus carota subsp. sativus TaxID=79200 RepID=A0AAF1BL09_DAUCS|nr:hypothetical protein DCAR_0935999 [Daucus carota subsp. sativus]